MADFCSKRISTVTGQVSLMPQAAVKGDHSIYQNIDEKGLKLKYETTVHNMKKKFMTSLLTDLSTTSLTNWSEKER